MRKKNTILAIILTVLILFQSYPVSALSTDLSKKTKSEYLESFTIPNLDKDGAMLQYSREELGNGVKNSKVAIDNISYDYPNVSIEGNVSVDGIKKPFLIEGTLKNSGDYDKNRIILVGQDVYGNFDIMDCSFYYTTQWLNPFNKDIPDWKNKSINTLYLLDKENRNFTFLETIPDGKTLEKQIELINN